MFKQYSQKNKVKSKKLIPKKQIKKRLVKNKEIPLEFEKLIEKAIQYTPKDN
jgi:hypothetical protein